ncbi:MAG: hypothetical protein KAU29_07740 [Gammaproteobacteria bacterium]|nr:hypothetical protein [Gammaproteobacteria bacterium]
MNIKTNKRVLALAISSVLMAPWAAQAGDDAQVSGFIDVIGNSDAAVVFGADAEVDVSKKIGSVTVRADMDANLAGNSGGSVGGEDSGRIEQAYFAWAATESITVLGGLFNNPIGQEAEDAPDMNFTSHSVTYNILDGQTVLYGNNVAGVAGAGAFGPVTVTAAVVDDLGLATTTSGEGKLSTAVVVNFSPMKGLDLELGYVTQDEQKVLGVATTAGNVTDLNGTFNIGAFTVGIDYLTAANAVDSAANVWMSFDINDKINVKARYETVSFEAAGVDDSSRTTLYASYAINDNLSAALESSTGSTDDVVADAISGIVDDGVTTLEFIGTF